MPADRWTLAGALRRPAAGPQPGSSCESKPALPRFAQIEPIGRCNLACRMCPVNERGDEVAELSIERFRELLDQMPRATFGNVFAADSARADRLLEHWHGEAAQSFRHELSSPCPPSACRSCALYRGTF